MRAVGRERTRGLLDDKFSVKTREMKGVPAGMVWGMRTAAAVRVPEVVSYVGSPFMSIPYVPKVMADLLTVDSTHVPAVASVRVIAELTSLVMILLGVRSLIVKPSPWVSETTTFAHL